RSYLKSDFIEFLRMFQLHRPFIEVKADGDNLSIVASGPQVHVMLFEIYVLAIVNELYFRALNAQHDMTEARSALSAKIDYVRTTLSHNGMRKHPFEFFDFGLRRRYSSAWQDEVVSTLAKELPAHFRGTSNVYLAKKYDLT